jgi:hypothetical protein
MPGKIAPHPINIPIKKLQIKFILKYINSNIKNELFSDFQNKFNGQAQCKNLKHILLLE